MHGRIRIGRWRLLGAVPVMSGDGPDIARSAAGRLAGEPALVPALSPAVFWEPVDDERALARVSIDDAEHQVTFTIVRGRPLPLGRPRRDGFREHTFGAEISAGWW
ncbi:DUF6920 family protein [Actinomadura macrotermitis]|uniref:Uncharacterized protein n=1 Tax=Actinomadura macrotermitis TaxID=2585200 RepID=A0A7K0BLN7_9ACTN|nr:DUF6544 family protein [Actinomadura macrotermitis]MQY02098.1 hypothetical protein [Actinomadura macrotermitis]